MRTVTAKFLVPVTYAGPDLIENTASATTSSPESVLGNNTAVYRWPTALQRIAGFNTLPPAGSSTPEMPPAPWAVPPSRPGLTRTFNVRSTCGLPGNASSVSFNITVTGPTRRRRPAALRGRDASRRSPRPSTTPPGQTRANNGIVPLSPRGPSA